eukprot:685083-Rhodomonas_salina.1
MKKPPTCTTSEAPALSNCPRFLSTNIVVAPLNQDEPAPCIPQAAHQQCLPCLLGGTVTQITVRQRLALQHAKTATV